MISAAFIMTCHNRRDLTLRCLRALNKIENCDDFSKKIYLVDDGSIDGTADAVREEYPEVSLIEGDGTLYWCGGMRRAWQEALIVGFDVYVWLNDDVELFDNAISDMLITYEQMRQQWGDKVIVSGSMLDPVTKKRSYGGALWQPRKEVAIEPGNNPKEVQIFAGNLVLVPQAVVDEIGILERRFTHGLSDYDYGLRARARGVKLFIAAKYQGYCVANIGVKWVDPSLSLAKRWALLHSPKGPPPREYMFYAWRHKRKLVPMIIAKMYARVLLPRLFK